MQARQTRDPHVKASGPTLSTLSSGSSSGTGVRRQAPPHRSQEGGLCQPQGGCLPQHWLREAGSSVRRAEAPALLLAEQPLALLKLSIKMQTPLGRKPLERPELTPGMMLSDRSPPAGPGPGPGLGIAGAGRWPLPGFAPCCEPGLLLGSSPCPRAPWALPWGLQGTASGPPSSGEMRALPPAPASGPAGGSASGRPVLPSPGVVSLLPAPPLPSSRESPVFGSLMGTRSLMKGLLLS